MPQRHVVVLSDLHLWQTTDSDDLWMRYRHRRFGPDAQLAKLFSLLCERIPPGQLELVLNGDIFDFDVPPIRDGRPQPARSPRHESAAVERMRDILADHSGFVLVLAKVLLLRHRVIFVIGNHDIQLHFAGVRELLLQQILSAARALEAPHAATQPHELSRRIEFHRWFYRSPLGIHIEHGQQYDPFCSVSDPVWPFHVDGRLHNTVGTLVIEHVIGRLGYFNPNVEHSYLLTTRQYLDHWLRYYWRSPRSLLRTFFFGALRILIGLLAENGLLGRGPRDSELQAADEAAHASLFVHWDVRATLRILRLDRMLLCLGLLIASVLLLFSPIAGLCAALLVVDVYRSIYPNRSHDFAEISAESQRTARRIARIYGVRAVIFGHSHEASGHVEAGVFYGNSGTWVPMHHDIACTMDIEPSRPLIWLHEQDGALRGGLYRFQRGQLRLAAGNPPPSLGDDRSIRRPISTGSATGAMSSRMATSVASAAPHVSPGSDGIQAAKSRTCHSPRADQAATSYVR